MRFQITTVAALVAVSSALPTLKVRQAGPVLADTTYDAISISGGQAGNAEAEALAVFSALDLNNPANIDQADIKFLNSVNQVANQAEKGAFNPAIEAATGAEADALAAGKTKNKVLKLVATKLQLEAKQAQGEDVSAKLEEELTKLNNNIATDKQNAGKPSTALPFDAAVSGGGNVAAGAGNNNNNANNNNANAGNNNNQDQAQGATGGANNAGNANDDAANDTNQNQNQNNNQGNQDQNNQNNQNQNTGNNNNAGGNGSGATGNFLFGGN